MTVEIEVEEDLPTLTLPEIQALPAVNPAQRTVCAVFGISQATYYRLAASGDLPVPILKIGASHKVLRSEILRAIGEQDANGAEAATSTPPAETRPSTP